MITVRTATTEDLEKIALAHIRCFPNSLSSQIGGGYLKTIIMSL